MLIQDYVQNFHIKILVKVLNFDNLKTEYMNKAR